VASVVVTTKNRKEELRTALASVFAQSVPLDVLIIDDGSSDGTSAMVKQEFPEARVIRHDESRGLIVRRNEGVRACATDIVISIDDDAAFSSPDIVAHTVREFSDDRIGAVAMPYLDVNRGHDVRQKAPAADAVYVTDRFIGTAHALRRDVFLRVGGYRDDLVHQGEEGDYCIRMLEAGFIVRLGTAAPIDHYESPRRDFSRMDYFGARNALLFVWQNVPLPFVLWHLPSVAVRVLVHTLQPRRFATRARGLFAAVAEFGSATRRPVSADTYRLSRHLSAAPRLLDDVALRFQRSAA
jgi:glycosyltransferase involved in cell wall biosynthesis